MTSPGAPENAANETTEGEAEPAAGQTDARGGLFDAIAAPLFEAQGDGSVLFYPFGWWSRRAYRLTDSERQARAKTSVRRFHIAAVIGGGLLGGAGQSYLSLGPFLGLVLPGVGAAVFVAYRAWVRRLTEGCETVDASLSVGEQLRRQAQAMGRGWAWLLAVVNLGLVLASGLLGLSATGVVPEGGSPVELGPAWTGLGLLVFGTGTVLSAWQLYLRNSSA
jgi:hypothetical protein